MPQTPPLEIERKFLVDPQGWAAQSRGEGLPTRQGYLSLDPERTVRVRLQGEQAWLTIKGATQGLTRSEYEYPIPPEDAEQMLQTLALHALSKRRFRVTVGGHVWDIDEFEGPLAGLILAEVELRSEDETFERPAWLGEEVSFDPRYFNAALARAGEIPAR